MRRKAPTVLEMLRDLIINCVNQLIGELCTSARVDIRYVYEVAVAANSVMLHLFLGVNPESIGRAPYSTVFRRGTVVDADSLRINASPMAQVYCLPSVSGFIGADIVGGVFATELEREVEPALLLDLGTNGEIVLCKDGRLLACSTAAGPALEGMNISCGNAGR